MGLVTALSAELSAGWRDVAYSSALYDNREFHEYWGAAGLRLRPSAISSLGVALRQTRGTYPRYVALAGGGFLADDYRGEYVDVTGTYRGTGKTELRAHQQRPHAPRERHAERLQRHHRQPGLDLGGHGQAGAHHEPDARAQQNACFLTNNPASRPLEYQPHLHRPEPARGLRGHRRQDRPDPLRLGPAPRAVAVHPAALAGGGATPRHRQRPAPSCWAWVALWTPVRCAAPGLRGRFGHEVRRGDAPLSSDLSGSTLACQVRAELR
jgi:hypothetical protein